MTETMLLEVDIDNDEFHLTLMDGSKWFVNPGDLSTVCSWTPTAEIRVRKNSNSTFDFDITNLSESVTIKAMQVA